MTQIEGLVVRSTGSWYQVRTDDGNYMDARVKGKFKIAGIRTTNPIAVGDRVVIDHIDAEENGVIMDILPRKNYIIRKSVNLSKDSHIIASNLDLAILVVTIAHPNTSTGFIDRFLATAEAYHIPVVLVFNKIDLLDSMETEGLSRLTASYARIGYSCINTSALNGEGVEEIKGVIKDKVTLLSGHSGAGKSSLINAIDPMIKTKVGELSSAHFKGMHTTTFAELFPLSFGGDIIDTPGIKGFGLVDFDKNELSHYFLEMREVLDQCKFNNCQHINEPSCAVLKGVENGSIATFRYKNYLAMMEDDSKGIYR